jgi:hypothetical protein
MPVRWLHAEVRVRSASGRVSAGLSVSYRALVLGSPGRQRRTAAIGAERRRTSRGRFDCRRISAIMATKKQAGSHKRMISVIFNVPSRSKFLPPTVNQKALRSSSGSLAKFTANRRASSRVSRFGRRAMRRSDMSGMGKKRKCAAVDDPTPEVGCASQQSRHGLQLVFGAFTTLNRRRGWNTAGPFHRRMRRAI